MNLIDNLLPINCLSPQHPGSFSTTVTMPSPTTITTAISQYPATFECTSGELVYGQVHCALEGLAQTSKRDGM